METIEDVETSAPPPPPAAPVSRASTPREMEREDDRGVREWLDSLVGGESAVKVVIRRKSPKLGPNGENIAGVLETVEDRIDEDYLREVWGGGSFFLQVQTPKAGGGFKIMRARSVDIAGEPKMRGVELVRKGDGAQHTITAGEDPLAERAFRSMEDLAKEERARADRAVAAAQAQAGRGGLDYVALQALQAPLIAQLQSATETIARLQADLAAALNRQPPRDELRDTLLQQAFATENRNVENLRAQYEARIDKLRDNHEDAIKRLEDRHKADIDRIEKRHEDEVRRLEAAHEREQKQQDRMGEMQTKSLDTANLARIESLNAEKSRLERDLNAAQARIAVLEAKKDQTISEKADELIKVKEALSGLGGDDDDDEDQKWYEKAFDMLGNSEAALKLIDKIGGGPNAQAQQQQAALPPPGVPFQNGDGNTYMVTPNGQVVIVDPRMIAAQQQRALAAARARRKQGKAPAAAQADADEQAVADAAPPIKPPAARDVKMAVSFMENAMKGGTDPVRFAATARNMVPGDVLRFIQRVGIDKFMESVVEPGSALATIRGRQFARAVFAALVGAEPVTTAVANEQVSDDAIDDGLGDDIGDDAGVGDDDVGQGG